MNQPRTDQTDTICTHEFHEQQSWIADGMCPLCVSEQAASYARKLDRLRAERDGQREENAKLRKSIEENLDRLRADTTELREALKDVMCWYSSGFAPQSQANAAKRANAILAKTAKEDK